MSPVPSFNEDQFIVSEVEQGVEIENISGASDVLSENHVGGERTGRESSYSSSPSLGNEMQPQSEDMSESVVENTQHVNALITISAPPTNQLFPSLVEPMQQEQNFVSVDPADGMNFAFQNRSMMPTNAFHPDNSFQMDAQMIHNHDLTFSLHDPANNGFNYVPTQNWQPELLDPAGRVQLPPFNHLSGSQIGIGIQNNGTNFVGSANWANMHNNTFGSQDIQFQQDLDAGMHGQGSFYLSGSTSNQVQFANTPYDQDGNHGRNFVNNNLIDAGQTSMMRMNMQNGMIQASELQQADGNYISDMENKRRLMTNSVYDPMYEAMGLPVDPHLRIFLSQPGHDGIENPAGEANNVGRNI